MAIKIVTDSTSDLPPALAQELGITVVPLNVQIDGKMYQDGIDIQADEFYRRLQTGKTLPTTSQPSAGAFIETYKGLATPDDTIVSIHISSKLSGTVNSALLAKKELPNYHIEVLDSLQVSLGQGLVIMEAARARNDGGSLEAVVSRARKAMASVHIFDLVDTLEYLEKGGRIGRVAAFLGSVLSVKPIITIKDGEVHPLERVRTRAKALERLYELASSMPKVAELGIVHSTCPEDAEHLAQRLSSTVPRNRIVMSRFGPVIGTYVGPGALGVAVRVGG